MIAWDAHAHVIGRPHDFPFWPGRTYTPAAAPLADYLAMLDRHQIARGVLVQPSVYGHDHRCLIDALDCAQGRLRGIAVPSPDATTHDLEAMHEHGIRGVRCNLINPGGLSPAIVAAWQPALRQMGWHVEFHLHVDRTVEWPEIVRGFDVPVVIDHMGRPSSGHVDLNAPPLAQLISLVRDRRCYVKLSAPYRLSDEIAPWPDVTPLAVALAGANPSACLWGTDWPHVDTERPVDTRDVVVALERWCGDAETRRGVTATTADGLFG